MTTGTDLAPYLGEVTPRSQLLDELARILGLDPEQDKHLFCIRKDGWIIFQIDHTNGERHLDRIRCVTSFREDADLFESCSPEQIAKVLFGIHPGGRVH